MKGAIPSIGVLSVGPEQQWSEQMMGWSPFVSYSLTAKSKTIDVSKFVVQQRRSNLRGPGTYPPGLWHMWALRCHTPITIFANPLDECKGTTDHPRVL